MVHLSRPGDYLSEDLIIFATPYYFISLLLFADPQQKEVEFTPNTPMQSSSPLKKHNKAHMYLHPS
jgi:hypothetical protein